MVTSRGKYLTYTVVISSIGQIPIGMSLGASLSVCLSHMSSGCWRHAAIQATPPLAMSRLRNLEKNCVVERLPS